MLRVRLFCTLNYSVNGVAAPLGGIGNFWTGGTARSTSTRSTCPIRWI